MFLKTVTQFKKMFFIESYNFSPKVLFSPDLGERKKNCFPICTFHIRFPHGNNFFFWDGVGIGRKAWAKVTYPILHLCQHLLSATV